MDLIKLEAALKQYNLKECHDVAVQFQKGMGDQLPADVSMADVVKSRYSMEWDSFMEALGINPNSDSVSNIIGTSDLDVKWIIPEIYRQAIRTGYRAAPIWPNAVAGEEQTTSLKQVIPYINMSDAAPRKLGEGETIPLARISYGQKSFRIWKMGRGISMPYEVRQYANLAVLKIFLEDFGVKMGHAMDTLLLDVLINGDNPDGSESAAVLGVATAGTLLYSDLLKIWIRMSRIGRVASTMIGGESAAIATLNLAEFKTPVVGTPMANLKMNIPIPKDLNYFVHAGVLDDQQIMLDPTRAAMKFNAQPLMVESEKIVSNQTEGFYATITTGFVKLFQDASFILDKSKAFASYGFPSYLDIDPLQQVTID